MRAPQTPLPPGKLYTVGIQFFVGRAHPVSLFPSVMALVEAGRLRPDELTTRVARWDQAEGAYLEGAVKWVGARR